jgi:hypothetical protein
MGVEKHPVVASDYAPGVSALVRKTCLEVATRLGDFQDQLCVVGGLVPSLIIPLSDLRESEEAHVGTIDLDLGFSVAVLNDQMYEEIAKRLTEAGFMPDQNSEGNTTAQRWKSAQGVTVDFLIPPSGPDDRGGKLRNLDENFAAFIMPGLDLAFMDSELVEIEDELPTGGKATRSIRVCGPSSFMVLKALAFGNRGTSKDAYDMFYVLRHHRLGANEIGVRIKGFGEHEQIGKAVEVLKRDFVGADLVGPVRVAEFLGGPDENLQADVVGVVRDCLDGAGVAVE